MKHSLEILKYLILFLRLSTVHNMNFPEEDICGSVNGKKVFLDLDESGVLVAKNDHKLSGDFYGNLTQKTCDVEFVTCPSCVVKISFRFLNISSSCGALNLPNSCSCDYVWVYEPQYEKLSGEQFCGRCIFNSDSELSYVSQTRKLKIAFLHSLDYQHAFTISFKAKRNTRILGGFPNIDSLNNSTHQWISSPYFPHKYPTDLSSEHVIKCKIPYHCRISLSFSDYMIGQESIMEFFDSNGYRMFVSSGTIFRPPILVSSGPSITIRFHANGFSNMGYRAGYEFISDQREYLKPSLDCGGWVRDLGGAITMVNMTEENSVKAYDCIYIIKPPLDYSHMKTHLYIQVALFSNFAGNTEVKIIQGPTSDGPLLDVLRHPISQYIVPFKEHVAPISDGFYVNLKGLFKSSSQLAIVYTAFNYKDCSSRSDFLCQNLRCITVYLVCDGFDHCGDNSDEQSNCLEGLKLNRQLLRVPNFLFEPTMQYDHTDPRWFLISLCFGFVIFFVGMGMYVYWGKRQAHRSLRFQDHLETINAILGEPTTDVEEEIIVPDNPPDYEAPPNYDEVIKNKMKVEENKQMMGSNFGQRGCANCSLEQGYLCYPGKYNSFLSNKQVAITPPPIYHSLDLLSLTSKPDDTVNFNCQTENQELIPSNIQGTSNNLLASVKDVVDESLSQRLESTEFVVAEQFKLRKCYSDMDLWKIYGPDFGKTSISRTRSTSVDNSSFNMRI